VIARSPARFLAPVAVVAFVVAAFLLIGNAGNDAKKTAKPAAPVVHRHVPKVYRVRPGDGLAAISDRYGVPVARILSMNPEVDPRSLQAGHLLQLRR